MTYINTTHGIESYEKFGNLIIPNHEILHGSHKKIECICDCGRKFSARSVNVYNKNTKSCGRCNEISAETISNMKFEKLKIKIPQIITSGSGKKIEWICDCGRETIAKVYLVISGKKTDCGRCNEIFISDTQKFGNLRIKHPQVVLPGSAKKIEWICDCGKETVAKIIYVKSGNTKSCGHCNEISAEEISKMKFGKLRIKYSQNILRYSDKKIEWICDCGREKLMIIHNVLSGHHVSCGRCKEISAEAISKEKYGRLHIKIPQDILPGSHKKIEWICNCGQTKFYEINKVISGRVKTCGHCNDVARNWYKNNKSEIQALRCPVIPSNMPAGGITPLEDIINSRTSFQSVCPSCKSVYKPLLHNIKRGKAITCGCSSNHISVSHKEIFEYIKSLEIDIQSEFKINNLTYDLYIPLYYTVIEYNGLRWHSMSHSKQRDFQKYNNAISNGYKFICIFEDEWNTNKFKFKNLLMNKFNSNFISLRSCEYEIKLINHKEADEFYDQFHHIGACEAKINYGAYYQDKLVACISFKFLIEQSKYQWEFIRMASDPLYKINDIWSKLLEQFIFEYKPTSIVSFSDNRLFSGEVYEKIGFKLDGEIPPDYYWTKGNKRLMKTKKEQEFILYGYKKIWDLGKKCWFLLCQS